MSRDTKRAWSELVEEADNAQKVQDVIMKPNSRENSNSRKKSKPNSEIKQSKPKKPVELETDPAILQRRQKQIDYGKNTVGYANFTQLVPLEERTKEHPKTPDKYSKYSRRAWDMLIKIWRKKLHEFDTDGNSNDNDVAGKASEDGDDVVGDIDDDSPSESSLNISLSFLDDD